MAKKFFYNRVYNTRRTIINIIIIGVCIIGVIICFIITSNSQIESKNKKEGILNIKDEVIIEVNQAISKEIFFSKIENMDFNIVDVIYGDDFDIGKPGNYKITIKVNDSKNQNTNYYSTLKIIDTTRPVLVTKNLSIKEDEFYSAKDFVTSCTDNSKKECIITFFDDGIDEEGNIVDYSKYNKEGLYPIKIIAKDQSGNITINETKLLIIKKSGRSTLKPNNTACKYGDDSYDVNANTLAFNITTNHCAVNSELLSRYYAQNGREYTNDDPTIKQLLLKEKERISKDINSLNFDNSSSINVLQNINSINNASNFGFIGYQIHVIISFTKNGENSLIAEYKLDTGGKRVFISNPYNLQA